MIEVQAPSRLHFGLLALDPDARRRFGGVGAMIAEPALHVQIRRADHVQASGVHAARAAEFARRLIDDDTLRLPLRGVAINVLSAPPAHVGLGSGTQLALAVAHGLLALAEIDGVGPGRLARLLGRGNRSAIGLNGFSTGGLLVDAGKTDSDTLAPIVSRLPLSGRWRFVLAIPRSLRGLHGPAEFNAFAQLPKLAEAVTDRLCRDVLLQLLPAAVDRDVRAFGQALYEINRRVGECFASQQGGIYAGPLLTSLVEFVRGQGIPGVGQSSWGPTIFALVGDPDQAQHLAAALRKEFHLAPDELLISSPSNAGATVQTVEPDRHARRSLARPTRATKVT